MRWHYQRPEEHNGTLPSWLLPASVTDSDDQSCKHEHKPHCPKHPELKDNVHQSTCSNSKQHKTF